MLIPTIMPAVGENLDFDPNQEYIMIGVFNLATGVAFYIFGLLADRSGRKKVILVGFVFSIALTLLFSFVSLYSFMLALSAGSGFFLGAYIPSSTAVLSDYYPQSKRGWVLGLHETGAVAGQFVGSTLVAIGILVLSWRQITGWWTLVGVVPLLLYTMVAPSRTRSQHLSTKSYKSTLPKSQTLYLILNYSGVLAGLTGFVFVLPVYLASALGVALAVSAGFIALSRPPAMIGQLVAGRLSDRYGRKPVLIGITSIVTLCTVVMAYSAFNALFIAALFIQFFVGAAFFPVVLAGISDVTTLEERSSKMGLAMSIGAIVGSGVVPIVIGYVALDFGYGIAFLVPVALCVASVVSAFKLKLGASPRYGITPQPV